MYMYNTHGEMTNAYKHVTEKSKGKSPHGKLSTHVNEIGPEVQTVDSYGSHCVR